MSTRQSLYDRLLNLDYEDVLRSCDVNDESRIICQDPVFWEEKAQRDYKTSLRQVESDRLLAPREKYLAILSEKDVRRGSEEFVDSRECLRRAIATGRNDLCEYFVEGGNIATDEVIIEATKDKQLFNDLIERYQLDIYADRELTYLVLLGAIRNKNFPLVRELSLRASQVIVSDGEIEELLNEAASTGDYELVDYIHDYFYLGAFPEEDIDEWLVQTALLRSDDSFAEDVINDMLARRQYEGLARAFVRAGDYDRLKNLISLADFEDNQNLGRNILLNAVIYNRLPIVRLVAEDPVFQVERRRSWFEEALDIAKENGNQEIITYLTNILREI